MIGMVTGCNKKTVTMQSLSLFAMDTYMDIQAMCRPEVLDEAGNMIHDLENIISVTNNTSTIYTLNNEGTAVFEKDAAKLITDAYAMCELTDGALDITIYPVLKAWGFTTGSMRVPEGDEIEGLLANVDYTKVNITGDKAESGDKAITVNIPSGVQIDLGSVAKGYTSDMIGNFLRQEGVGSALINLGGNVMCIGTKSSGDLWKVAIKSPFTDSKSGIIGVYEAKDEAIITSGGYERYFEQDGNIYWHILDPATGAPVRNGLVSVTVIGKKGIVCDALSTAVFVMGLEKGTLFWQEHPELEVDLVFVTEQKDIYVTEGIADKFSLSSEYQDITPVIIYR